MASDTVKDCTENAASQLTDEGLSPVKQKLEDVEGKLVSLSEKITLCNRVLNDLKDLSDVLVRKSLHDVSLSPLRK